MKRILDFDPVARHSGPWLQCPIPPAIHDLVAGARESCESWAVAMGLAEPGSAALRVLRAGRFANLAARTYDYANAEQLALGADWATFLFFYDDIVDVAISQRGETAEEELVGLDAAIVASLRGAPCSSDAPPLVAAAADIRRRLQSMASAQWAERLADDTALYLQGVRWERAVERTHAPLTLATYRHMRPMISAVPTVLTLGAAFLCPTRPDVGRSPLLQELARVANNHICWVNDIYGLDRELAFEQRANVVVALASTEAIPLRDALDRAIVLCNAEMDTFVGIERHLQQIGDGEDPYVQVVSRWVRGNLDWHCESGRYRSAGTLRGKAAA